MGVAEFAAPVNDIANKKEAANIYNKLQNRISTGSSHAVLYIVHTYH